MGMAWKADLIKATLISGSDKPIDLVYLSSMTMGDKTLEAEVLQMFCSQLPLYFSQLECEQDIRTVKTIGHTLKGAARSVGALRMAELAEEYEVYGNGKHADLVREGKRIEQYVRTLYN